MTEDLKEFSQFMGLDQPDEASGPQGDNEDLEEAYDESAYDESYDEDDYEDPYDELDEEEEEEYDEEGEEEDDWVEEVIQQLKERRTIDLTKVPPFRRAQRSWEKQKAELLRKNRALEAQVQALQAQIEASQRLQELEEKARQARTPEEAARLIRELVEEQARQQVVQAEVEAAKARLGEWDDYYVNELGVPPEVVERFSQQVASLFDQKGMPLNAETLRQFHEMRHSLIEAWVAERGSRDGKPQPDRREKRGKKARRGRTPQTVVPRQGAVGTPDPLDLFQQGRWDDLSRLIR